MNSTLLFSILACVALSCTRVKRKSQELVGRASEKVVNKKDELVDKVLPQFDAHQSDTKFNKLRFKDFLQVELTPDIHTIYCFDDAVGIDKDYMFSFNCNAETAQKIITKHQLKLDKSTTDYGFGMQHDFEWWDKQKIEKLDLYSWTDRNQYFKYFWYDVSEQKAYFFDFDM